MKRRKTALGLIAVILVVGAGAALSAPAVVSSTGFVAMTGLIKAFSWAVSEWDVRAETGIAYGPLPRQQLDIYRPRDSDDGPIAIFVYGGSWTAGERGMYGFVGAALASRGITTVVPDYRLAPEVLFPTFVEDTALAVWWTAQNMRRPDGSQRDIVLIGHSAGAHIAALIAYDPSYLAALAPDMTRPIGFIGLSGPYAFDPTTWPTTKDIFVGLSSPDVARPVVFAGRALGPPAFLFHGKDDTIVEPKASVAMQAALRNAGTPVQLEIPEGFGHVGTVQAIARPFRWRAPVLETMLEFIMKLPHKPAGRSQGTSPAARG